MPDRIPEQNRLLEGSLVSFINSFMHAIHQFELVSSLNQLKHCLARTVWEI